jgi:metal-dependent hydrolase (beta-lactamase superfamily II)
MQWHVLFVCHISKCSMQALGLQLMQALRVQSMQCCACPAVSHGHVDHVGATPELAAAYPDMQVVMHELEAPFVVGEQSYILHS